MRIHTLFSIYSLIITLTLVFPGLTVLANEPIHIKVATPPYVYNHFKNWNARSHCKTLQSYQSEHANRATVDLMLLCRALAQSQFVFDLEPISYPNYARALAEVSNGQAHTHAETVWGSEIDLGTLYTSSPIIRNGEFAKGIYVKVGNTKLDNVRSLEDLRAFQGVMVKSWVVDWKTISGFGLKGLLEANGLESIYKLIHFDRADFTLLEFSKAQHKVSSLNEFQLRPVSGVKVGLDGFRSFVISKKAPHAKTLYDHLQKGIGLLREQGEIERAYTESGFFDASVKDWKLLNAKLPQAANL